MSRNRAKGTAAESAIVKYLVARGWPHAERRALNGSNDKGDIAGLVGVCIEVKNHKVSSQSFPAYVDEAEVEKTNAKAEVGVAWVKRRGTTDPAKWLVAMTGEQFTALLKAAGW